MESPSINHVSDTSLWVAAWRAIESERPDALYHDPLAKVLAGARGEQLAKTMPHGKVTAWVMAVRTVAIDRLIQGAIQHGIDAVINLGAGLDTRPYRLQLPPNFLWIEVDFPFLINEKQQKLLNENPRCRLERFGMDLTNRAEAVPRLKQIGEKFKSGLVLTEGVVPYLSNEQAGELAADLLKVPSFHFWIMDYFKANKAWHHPKKLKEKLINSPFKFKHAEPLDFFASHGWKTKEVIFASEEGERLGRRFPFPFPWNFLSRFMPKDDRKLFKESRGYALLSR